MSTRGRLRADTHVHFYDCFDERWFLSAATNHLCTESGKKDEISAALCLTETSGDHWFSKLQTVGLDARDGDAEWDLIRTREENSLLVRNRQGDTIAIIAGRQIVCVERLELLALGLARTISDGQPIRDTMRQVADQNAIPVLAWGAGKWTGARGKIVEQLISDPPCSFLIGDNGGRLAILPEPSLFSKAREREIAILPGSDPLPFSWNSKNVGSYGIEWTGSLGLLTPFEDLKAYLNKAHSDGQTFGQLEKVIPFIRNQIALRFRRPVKT